MNNRKEYIFLPFLDDEFQCIYGVTKNYRKNYLLTTLYQAIKISILLSDKGIIMIPAFIAEAELTRELLKHNPEILESRYITCFMKEKNKQDYIEIKEYYYKDSKNFTKYSSKEFKDIFQNSKFKIFKKPSSKEFIKENITVKSSIFSNPIEAKEVLTAIERIAEKPLIWENISDVLEKRIITINEYKFRIFLNNLYNNSILNNYNCSILKFDTLCNTYVNYPKAYIYDADLFVKILHILDIESILEFNLITIEKLKDSPFFIIFLDEYFKLFNMYHDEISISKQVSINFDEHKKNLLNYIKELKKEYNKTIYHKNKEGVFMQNNIHGLDNIESESERLVKIIFTDIVGFSKETTMRQLNMVKILRDTIHKYLVEINFDNSYCISTGDGMAIIIEDYSTVKDFVTFLNNFLSEINNIHGIKIRTGIHSGQVNIIKFENNTFNVIGHNVNMTSRVMDIGDENHILISKAFYSSFFEKSEYHNLCSYLGNIKIKHEELIEVYNFVHEKVGNNNIPKKIKDIS